MLFWVALVVFGIPLLVAVMLRRKHNQKYQDELDEIQRRIAEKESEKKRNRIWKIDDSFCSA